jgi:hypothetical protein
MSTSDDITPPESTAGDVAHTLARAGLSAIPVIGGAAVELLQAIVTPPLERRRREWMHAVGNMLRQLELQQRLVIEQLPNNPAFIDAALSAFQAALRTSQQEKLDALRNAAVNAALPDAPQVELQQLFIRVVDELTAWHLRVLAYFHDPQQLLRAKQLGQVFGSPVTSFEQVFPELFDGRDDLLDQIWRDLLIRGLVGEGRGITDRLSEGSWSRKQTSVLGDDLLRFIRTPVHEA